MPLLQSINGQSSGQRYTLSDDRTVLGRDTDCDIVLGLGGVSRKHAQVLAIDGEYYVENLKSRNGTFLNGEQICGRQKLHENDLLTVCDLEFSFHVRSHGAVLVDDAPDDCKATITTTRDVSAGRDDVRQTAVNPETKLRAMMELSRNVGSTLARHEVLSKILDSLFSIFPQADRGFVVLRMGEDGPLAIQAEKHRVANTNIPARISRTIVDTAMRSAEAILSADVASDPRFEGSQSSAILQIRSMMCVPIIDAQGLALGAIQVDSFDQRTPFLRDDLEVLASVAGLASVAVENTQLHETAVKQQALDRDLKLARDVQHRFLPEQPPVYEGYEFFHFYEAADQVGGDCYDYLPLPGDRLAVFVADVAGKGIPAALLMAKLSAEVRYSMVGQCDPAAVVNGLNARWEERFVTMIVAVIDRARHRVQIVNAGHLTPFLRHVDGLAVQVGFEATGLPVGVSHDFKYQSFTIELAPGDALVIFTDGISEAMDSADAMYGLERFEQQLRGGHGAREIGERILADVEQFVGGQPQHDDMCLLCFGRV
ncbi:MAG TPA: SpoIIE family protein phosphatase [Pirellulales bacterium]|jgi:serine phosphatase RsbU (regulator of sigma subunit)/pSer/pThr/pTyr-binding forkhead associated (FHA) protein|nr:SpoIIE family protein phosphatase [Pirellulales bacterium]